MSEMSKEEMDKEITTIAKTVKSAKIWIPMIVLVCTGFWFVVRSVWSVKDTYDNDVAKKEDIRVMNVKLDALT